MRFVKFAIYAAVTVLGIALAYHRISTGLLEGNTAFFWKQVVAVLFSSVWAFVFTYGMLWLIDRVVPVKVKEGEEELGLDETQHGEKAYETGAL